MAQHTYAFSLPRKPITRFRIPSARLLWFCTLLWLLIYGWLAYRLWSYGLLGGWLVNGSLILLTILLGVFVVYSWRQRGWRWVNSMRQGGKWRALSPSAMYQLNPSEFEAYVAQRIFARQGYHVHNTPDTKDGGIDILITDDSGQQAIVQCKRYKGTVGSATVRELYGTMIHTGAARAYLATTADISNDARRWAEGKPIVLLDGARLEQLARSPAGAHLI